jgi:hypothetical protein
MPDDFFNGATVTITKKKKTRHWQTRARAGALLRHMGNQSGTHDPAG